MTNAWTNGTPWTRRDWLKTQSAAFLASSGVALGWTVYPRAAGAEVAALTEQTTRRGDPAAWEALAQRGVDVARSAGASYADARITRTVIHRYEFAEGPGSCIMAEAELNGIGIRALVNGFWGFAAAPRLSADSVDRLARDAVAQAKSNALGTTRRTELVRSEPVRGRWTTPVKTDAFSLSLEEKSDYIGSWLDYAERMGVPIDRMISYVQLVRQERTVATTDGTLISLATYESGGSMASTRIENGLRVSVSLDRVDVAGAGWERFLDANIIDQLTQLPERMREESDLMKKARPAIVGRYTLVCDGATMGALIDQTFGPATQIDRALGYEANASGTSMFDAPLTMVGTEQAAVPSVTLTGNRSVPGQLATVAWDDEGVVPKPFTIMKDGVLTDFQTTREQAPWLAPYYTRQGRPVVSHGCAAAENALKITMQHTPNLTLEPTRPGAAIDDLIANVPAGLLLTNGNVVSDFQGRTGRVSGRMRKITNGRLGALVTNGEVAFRTKDLWKQIVTMGGPQSLVTTGVTQYTLWSMLGFPAFVQLGGTKGEPPQITSHSVTAPAATIAGQAIVDPTRKL